MKFNRLRVTALLNTAIAAALPYSAWAQEQANAPSPQISQPQEGIEDIVVTARKREENLRDVPVSVTALSSQALAQSKISQLTDLASRVPNLTVSAAGNLPFTLIRGFGTGSNVSFEQAVGKFVDNVSYGRDQDLRLPLFDVERVEVLRGPQVLLYGNSTTAGALNITTKKPGDTLAADASVAYNFNYDEVIAQGGVTVPVTEGVSLRVAGFYQYRDKGLTFNELTGTRDPSLRNYAGRAILQLEPTDSLKVTLKAEYDRAHENGDSSELMSQPVLGIFPFLPPLPPFADAKLDSRKASDQRTAPFFQREFLTARNQTYQGDINYDLGDGAGQLTSTTGYRKLAFAQAAKEPTPINLLDAFIGYRYNQFSQELRYANSLGPVDLTLGGYYQRDTFHVRTVIGVNLPMVGFPPFALDGTLDQVQKSYSLFGDLTYHLTDSLSVEAGGRYTWVRKTADQAAFAGELVANKTLSTFDAAIVPNPAYEPFFSAAQGGVPSHSFTGLKYRDGFFQPQVVVQYKPSSTSQIFAKYVKGAKAGGFDYFYVGVLPVGPTRDGAQFKSEKAESFEVGTKGLLFDRKVEYSLVLFRTTFTDLQASQFRTAAFVTTNVGEARTQGVEIDLNYAPFTGLKLGISGAYLDAKYLDYAGQPCTVAQLVAAGGGTCTQDLSGASTQYSSKWTGSFNADYQWALSASLDMSVGASVYARSRYNASTNNEPLQDQSGFAKVDGRIELRDTDRHFTIGVFGKNLTNKRTLEFGTQAPLTGYALSGFRSIGREIGVRFGFNF